MNLHIGVANKERKGVFSDIHTFTYIQSDNYEPGVLSVTKENIELSNGENIRLDSFYIKETKGLALEVYQDNEKILLLGCSKEFDLLCRTNNGFDVRFYTCA